MKNSNQMNDETFKILSGCINKEEVIRQAKTISDSEVKRLMNSYNKPKTFGRMFPRDLAILSYCAKFGRLTFNVKANKYLAI